jgi:hypothetical protein
MEACDGRHMSEPGCRLCCLSTTGNEFSMMARALAQTAKKVASELAVAYKVPEKHPKKTIKLRDPKWEALRGLSIMSRISRLAREQQPEAASRRQN